MRGSAGLGDVARQVLGAAAAIGRSFDLDTVRAGERTQRRGDRERARGARRAGRRPRGPGTGAALRLLPPEAARARLRADRPRAAAPAAPARRRRAVEARPGDESAAAASLQHLRLAGDDARRGGAATASPRSTPRRCTLTPTRSSTSRRRWRSASPDTAGAARAHRRPAHARGRLRRRARELRDAPPPSARAGAGARSSTSSAACTTAAANGSARRRASLAALDAAPPGARAAGAHRRPTSPSRCITPAGSSDATALATRGARAGRGRRRPARPGAGPQHARRARPERGRARGRARAELERSLALAEELGDAPARAAALNNLALVERDAGELDRGARADGERAGAVRRLRRPPPRGRAREQPRRPAPRRRATTRRRWSTSSGRSRSSPRWAPTRPPASRRSGSSSAGDHAPYRFLRAGSRSAVPARAVADGGIGGGQVQRKRDLEERRQPRGAVRPSQPGRRTSSWRAGSARSSVPSAACEHLYRLHRRAGVLVVILAATHVLFLTLHAGGARSTSTCRLRDGDIHGRRRIRCC